MELRMLRADDEKKDEKIDEEFDIIDEAEAKQQCEVATTSYPAAMLYGASRVARSGFVYSAKTLTGCYVAVEIAPALVNYMAPTSTILRTTTAAAGVAGFGVGSIVGTASAEALLYIAGSVASTAVEYAFAQGPASDAPKNKIE